MEVFSSDKKRRHDYFLKLIQKRSNEIEHIYRIILIGTGESGKSTFVKQMKLLSSFNQSFPEMYRIKFVSEIRRNIIQSLFLITNFMKEEMIDFAYNQIYSMKEMLDFRNYLFEVKSKIDINPDYIQTNICLNAQTHLHFFHTCTTLWCDNAVKSTSSRANEYQLIDCAQYFLDKLDEIGQLNYKPTDDDILQSRTKTLGIHTETLLINNIHFEFVDVGGQREQRGKWIEAMSDGVTAVIFLTDVSAYDMMLAEDPQINRLRDSISLLGQIWTKSPLAEKSIILFLNKKDKLEKKIRDEQTDIEDYFPEYKETKIEFVINLINNLYQIRLTKPKKEAEILEKLFGPFLPAVAVKRTSKISVENKSLGNRNISLSNNKNELLIASEFNQIQSLLNELLNYKSEDWNRNIEQENIDLDYYDNAINNVLNNQLKSDSTNNPSVFITPAILKYQQFKIAQHNLNSIPLFKLVSITNFIQNLFISNCEQTVNRHVYAYPTTAIDRRNVTSLFNSCKDILQGKALTDLIA